METRTYPITDDALALTVQSLDELALRLETEASAFALLQTREGTRGRARLEQGARCPAAVRILLTPVRRK